MGEFAGELADIVGSQNVLQDKAGLICYAADFFPRTWHKPDYVVIPHNIDEISSVVRLAYEHRIPVIPRGSGTSVTGGPVPIEGGIVIDLSNMNRIIGVDEENRTVTVEPGIAWEELNKALKKYRLFYPSTPGSGRTSSVGGSVANGGSGMRTVKYGTIRNYVLELKVVLPDGEIVKLGSKVRKTSCGYDLRNLFIGCEGTLGVIAEVTLRLCTLPQQSAIIAVEFEDWDVVKQTILHILTSGIVPSALELTTAETLRLVAEPIAADTVASLLIELHGSEATVRDETQRILRGCSGLKTRLITAEGEQDRMWKRNGEIYFKLIRLKPSPIAEDLGVPVASVSEAVRLVSHIFQRYGIDAGIMSHAGDGTIHCVIAVDERDEDEWERALKARGEIYRSVIEMNGTITAEHGLGLHRSPFAAQELGASLDIMRRVKWALDPRNIMNPGKMALGEPR